MTNHKRVELKTENGTFALNAVEFIQYESFQMQLHVFFKKKYDTGIFYYTDGKWYGYGDLDE